MCVMLVRKLALSSVMLFFFFKQKTAYEMRISDWSSDVCSSDLIRRSPCATSITAMAPRGNRASRIRAGVRSSCRSSSTTCDGRRGLRAAAVERSHGLVARGAGTGAFGVVGAALRGAWGQGPGGLRGRFHPFAHRLSGEGGYTAINRLCYR